MAAERLIPEDSDFSAWPLKELPDVGQHPETTNSLGHNDLVGVAPDNAAPIRLWLASVEQTATVGKAAAAVFGSSSGTPTVSMGAATMKMIRSTSITSTKGVTLISLIAAARPLRRPRRPPPPDDLMTPPAIAQESSWRDRIVANSSAKLS